MLGGNKSGSFDNMQSMSLEELQKMDLSSQLMKHVEGTELDRKMD